MNKHLSVYLHESRAGELTQDKHGRISFAYDEGWLESASALPLSHSLPLRAEPFDGKECQGFFAGVLPEEDNRRLIAAILGISARNDFALLEQIGGECAGAVTFLPVESKLPASDFEYQTLTEDELGEILRELPKRPLMAGKRNVRLSLAGAQNKLAVFVDENGISLPLRNAPSTHILKPAIANFDGVVQNELFCMELARKLGLPTAKVSKGNSEGIEYLLVERYDRLRIAGGGTMRLHQEDFCQALGLPPYMKYQNEGGPTLAQCFSLVREVSTSPAPDLLNLLDAVVFNYLIGNNDAHGKNFSFLYKTVSGVRVAGLAPFYDLISTRFYEELSPKMAMKIGTKYLPQQVALRHWESLWEQAGFPKNSARQRTLRFTAKLQKTLDGLPSSGELAQKILQATAERADHLRIILG
jgi:serine/threonine-protein kinase HipA